MEIKPVRTKADHRAALKRIEALMSARAGTPAGELVAAWESRLHLVPEAFAAHIAAEIARWGEVVKRAGMEAQ
jgi:tripartite-type tricarboxylate transporter receptor subunit TctC